MRYKMILTTLSARLRKHLQEVLFGLVAMLAYLLGIFWGLPYAVRSENVHGWDVDSVNGLQTLSELSNLISAKPGWWTAYPVFHYLLLGVSYVPYFGYLYLTNGIGPTTPTFPYGLKDPESTLRHLVLIGRVVTLAMAAGVVLNSYLTAKILWDERTARYAGSIAALSTPMIYYSATGNLDVPVLFWLSLVLLLVAKCLVSGFTTRRAISLGVISAIAVATKDQAYAPVGVALIGLIFAHRYRRSSNETPLAHWRPSLVLVLSGLLGFILASGLLLSPSRFVDHIRFVLDFRTTFWNVANLDILYSPTLSGYTHLSLDFIYALYNALGPFFLLAGTIGALLTIRRSAFARILVLGLVSMVVFVVFPILHMQYRYILLPAYIMSLFAGWAITFGFKQDALIRRITFVLTVCSFLWLGFPMIDTNYARFFDARYSAAAWINKHASPGDRIGVNSLNGLPPINPGFLVLSLDGSQITEAIRRHELQYVLVYPDFSNTPDEVHSTLFPESTYDELEDGTAGYDRVALLKTTSIFEPLWKLSPLFPNHLINKRVEIFRLRRDDTLARNGYIQ